MDLEFRYLRDFLAVMESGSRSAMRRGGSKTSQPTLTRSVKLLEQSVGGAVFEIARRKACARRRSAVPSRSVRGSLSASGFGSAQRELDDLVEGRRGRVVVGTGPVFGVPVILPRAIARFQAKASACRCPCHPGPVARDAAPRRVAGEIDCAFHSASDGLAIQDLAHRVLIRSQALSVVARRDHPLAGKKRIALAEIAGQTTWLRCRRGRIFALALRYALPTRRAYAADAAHRIQFDRQRAALPAREQAAADLPGQHVWSRTWSKAGR